VSSRERETETEKGELRPIYAWPGLARILTTVFGNGNENVNGYGCYTFPRFTHTHRHTHTHTHTLYLYL